MQFLQAAADMMEDRPIYRQLHELGRLFRRGDRAVRKAKAIGPVWKTIATGAANDASPGDNWSKVGFRAAKLQHDAAEFLAYLLTRLFSAEVPVDIYEYVDLNGKERSSHLLTRGTANAPLYIGGSLPLRLPCETYTLVSAGRSIDSQYRQRMQ